MLLEYSSSSSFSIFFFFSDWGVDNPSWEIGSFRWFVILKPDLPIKVIVLLNGSLFSEEIKILHDQFFNINPKIFQTTRKYFLSSFLKHSAGIPLNSLFFFLFIEVQETTSNETLFLIFRLANHLGRKIWIFWTVFYIGSAAFGSFTVDRVLEEL